MTEQTELKAAGNQTTETGQAALEKRRRLLKLGVSAAPVVLTLASRSALACHCKSPSAAGSLTFASHKPAGTDDTGAFDITAYVKPYSAWMSIGGTLPGGVTKNTRINAIPTIGGAFGSDVTKIVDLAVGFRRDIVTAYLNLSNGGLLVQGECLTILKLKAMASGSYTDLSSGTTWDQSQIQSYLASNYLLG
jgi:hypothetical protein